MQNTKRPKDDSLTQGRVRVLFDYYPDTGILFRRKAKNNASRGEVKGSKNHGYYVVQVDGVRTYVHRIIWLYAYGSMPDEEIDHINHDRADNRICNLRAASRKENARNRRITRRNKSGHVGVRFHKNKAKWIANIGVDGRLVHLGYFERVADAAKARRSAERQYGFHDNHGRP